MPILPRDCSCGPKKSVRKLAKQMKTNSFPAAFNRSVPRHLRGLNRPQNSWQVQCRIMRWSHDRGRAPGLEDVSEQSHYKPRSSGLSWKLLEGATERTLPAKAATPRTLVKNTFKKAQGPIFKTYPSHFCTSGNLSAPAG